MSPKRIRMSRAKGWRMRERLETSKVVIGDCTLYNEDCRFILPTLPRKGVAVVSDPPYGMDWNTDHSRFSPGPNGTGGKKAIDWQKPINGDDEPFNPTPLLSFEETIIWGSNHYAALLPVGTTLVWIKRLDSGFGSFLSDAEIGWQKGGHGVYCHRDLSMQGESSRRLHPTQKPLGLMSWCIQRVKAQTIIDPYMGSGSTLVAAVKLGKKAIGIENDPNHFATACRRITDAYKQGDLFVSPPSSKPEQLSIL